MTPGAHWSLEALRKDCRGCRSLAVDAPEEDLEKAESQIYNLVLSRDRHFSHLIGESLLGHIALICSTFSDN